MPPPVDDLSDDESTGESIPYNDANDADDANDTNDANDANNTNDTNDVDEQEDVPVDEKKKGRGRGRGRGKAKAKVEPAEEVYTVEKIMGHEFTKGGKLLLQVKWQGYEDPADQTLEPEENLLEGAEDILAEYFESQGGRPQKPVVARKRKSMGAVKATPEKTETPKRQKRSAAPTTAPSTETPEESEVPDWVPKSKSWENDVKKVDTIIRDPKTNSLIVFLHWTNGKTSKVSIETCYEKCPRKMLQFYEQHLVFKDA